MNIGTIYCNFASVSIMKKKNIFIEFVKSNGQKKTKKSERQIIKNNKPLTTTKKCKQLLETNY